MNTATNAKTGTRMLAIRARHLRAVELRREGKTYDEIADELGYANRGCAYKGVVAAMADARKEIAIPTLNEELGRLDAMQVMANEIVDNAGGDPDLVLRGVALALAVMDRRARYLGLYGLGKRMTGTTVIEEEVRRLSELTGLSEGAILGEAAIVSGR